MEMIWLPEGIRRQTEGERFREETIGASGFRVLIGEETVLKIGPQSGETERERRVLSWLEGRLPVPRLLAYETAEGRAYTLMTRLKGRMLCDAVYLDDPERLRRLLAQALEQLAAVDTAACTCEQRLDTVLEEARRRVERRQVDPAACEPGTFGPDGFRDPEALLVWLEANRPGEEELCFTHGDLCLPNILAEGDRITGFIDCGGMGTADRWRDLALCLRSLQKNLAGDYGGPRRDGYAPDALLAALGLRMDTEKYRYYLLLDELF